MSSEQMKITLPLAIVMFIIGILITFFGWVTTKTLNDINTNITQLGEKIESLSSVRYDHETRIRLLEERASSNTKNLKKLEPLIPEDK